MDINISNSMYIMSHHDIYYKHICNVYHHTHTHTRTHKNTIQINLKWQVEKHKLSTVMVYILHCYCLYFIDMVYLLYCYVQCHNIIIVNSPHNPLIHLGASVGH